MMQDFKDYDDLVKDLSIKGRQELEQISKTNKLSLEQYIKLMFFVDKEDKYSIWRSYLP